jgi:sn-glycerol 3-phosphate transport system ATP-binding protein
VDFVEELGASRVVHLDWAGQRLAVVQNEPTRLRPGDLAKFTFRPKDAHVFALDSGERLDFAASAREGALA